MSLRFAADDTALPVFAAAPGALPEGLGEPARRWADSAGFKARAGEVLVLPGTDGAPAGALLGLGQAKGPEAAMLAGQLAQSLPSGAWRLTGEALDPELAALALHLGAYSFDRYREAPRPERDLVFSGFADGAVARAERLGAASRLARDLINTPASDMGPAEIEAAARSLGERFGAEISVIAGDALLEANFPMIHAVGRASISVPRLIDLAWGPQDGETVTLVGKGVAFDTGGLDIKPASGMLLMKKDMGGAANVLGLAQAIMSAGLKLRLRVLIPAVENAISGDAFRPGDILRSRKGKTVEIGNTDAEGRLILADALSLADEAAPRLLIDMATLTGAARVALGPELPPFFTHDEALAGDLTQASQAVADPIWRLPLYKPYAANLSSKIADTNNVTSDGFAGAITAALFLDGFVEKAASWAHFDVYGWRPKAGPTGPVGGEAQAIRALFAVLEKRFG